MQFKPRSTRFIALSTAAILASATFFHSAPAHADKAKTYKYGAIGLGVLGAYMLSKGKTLPGAAAIAGGAYAYKKSQQAKDDRYSRYPDDYSSGYDYGYDQDYRGQRNGSNAAYPYNGTNYGSNPRQERRQARRDTRRDSRQNNYDLSPYLR